MAAFTEQQKTEFSMQKWYDLSGKTAVVTGGITGLGLAITRCLVSAGAKVIGSFTIGKNSKIGAGSVVIEEVPPNCTVVGVPGRIVRMGDQKVPSADLDQIHLPDPVLNDIRQLQTDNIRLKKELKALKEKLAKEKIIEEA